MKFAILTCALVLTTCYSAEIPNFLKKCNRKDSDFDKCLAAAIEDVLVRSTNPVKEIGLASLEPLEIPSMVIGEGTGAVAFQQNFKDIKITGFAKAKCSKAEMNFDAKTLTLECQAPLVRMDFHYEINGKLLVLPIRGKGPGFMEMDNLKVQVTFNLEEYEKKGKKHYKVAKNKLVFTPQLIKFHLDNLFDGDKALGDNINQVLNQNWQEVFADVKDGYEEAFGQILSSIFDNVLKKVSETELFGDA